MKKLALVLGLLSIFILGGCGAPTDKEVKAVQDVKPVENRNISISRQGDTIFSTATYESAFKYVNRAVDIYGYKVTKKDATKGYVMAVPAQTRPLGSESQPVLEVMLSDLRNDGIKAKVKVSVNGKYDEKMSKKVAEMMVDRFIAILNQIAAQNRK